MAGGVGMWGLECRKQAFITHQGSRTEGFRVCMAELRHESKMILPDRPETMGEEEHWH